MDLLYTLLHGEKALINNLPLYLEFLKEAPASPVLIIALVTAKGEPELKKSQRLHDIASHKIAGFMNCATKTFPVGN
jgi:hypothetical protein